MPDIFSYDVVAALSRRGCPLCRTVAADDRRALDAFWREGRQDSGIRKRFVAAGGFCREHAWLLHRLVDAQGAGAAIADVYGSLAEHDLRRLEQARTSLTKRSRGRRRITLTRRPRCPACRAREEAANPKVHFFLQALAEPRVEARYRSSDGFCFTHFSAVFDQAVADGRRELALLLLDDWADRLADVRSGLAEYDRKRDYRYADEPRGAEQRAWTEVIRRYVGGSSRRRER